MAIATILPGDAPDIHIVCFGNPIVALVDTLFFAVATNVHLQ
jgi:hypothetical protein